MPEERNMVRNTQNDDADVEEIQRWLSESDTSLSKTLPEDDVAPVNGQSEDSIPLENDFGCRDRETTSCGLWKKSGYCVTMKKKMKYWCRETCELCKAPAPPACERSEFGCCWNDANAEGPDQEGCPECKNVMSEIFCDRLKGACDDLSSAEFMKMRCPIQCGYC